MSDLVRNPEDLFSHNEAQFILCSTSLTPPALIHVFEKMSRHLIGKSQYFLWLHIHVFCNIVQNNIAEDITVLITLLTYLIFCKQLFSHIIFFPFRGSYHIHSSPVGCVPWPCDKETHVGGHVDGHCRAAPGRPGGYCVRVQR